MAVKTFTSTALSSSDVNTYLANAGLVYITQVTLSGSYTDLSGCFNATYGSYRLIVQNLVTNGSDPITVQMLNSGTPATTNYARQRLYVQVTTVGATSVTGQSSLIIGYTANGYRQHFSYDIYEPFVSQYTRFTGTENYVDGSGIPYLDFTSGMHTVASGYNGLRFACGTNSFSSGTAVMYGYRTA